MIGRRDALTLTCLTLGLFFLTFLLTGAGNFWRQTDGADLASRLYLQWVRDYPPLKPAWPDQAMMQFDAAYQPVAAAGTLLIGSSRNDQLIALDTETGQEKWRFNASGPIRLAPAAWQDKAYCASDDGHLYCLNIEDGCLLWKFRGGPSDKRILGNNRLISMWPARGGPVAADGVVYFTAGIWPFMGIFMHALDAQTGEALWTNDGDGSLYIKQPHMADAFAGVAPQGSLVAVGDKLLIPGGRSIPACYHRETGQLLYYRLADNGKRGGGSAVQAAGRFFLNGGAAYEIETGDYLGPVGSPAVLTPEALYSCSGTQCQAFDLTRVTVNREPDILGRKVPRTQWKMPSLGTATIPRAEVMIKAGARLYLAGINQVFAVDLPLQEGRNPVTWREAIQGRPVHLVAADDRLFVSTREGKIYCFGDTPVDVATYPLTTTTTPPADEWREQAKEIRDATGVRDGYCLVWGVGTGKLITELLRETNLHLIIVEPDERKVERCREELAAAGWYGERAEVCSGDPEYFNLPPYLASVMVAEDLQAAGVEDTPAFVKKCFASLRPFGGVACLPIPAEERSAVSALLASDASLGQARYKENGRWVLISRDGPLPGSGNWTHEHADAANTRVSRDKIVKAPLGLLWFGGPTNEGILPRHGHGPMPQVVDGRLIIEGVDFLRAIDIYTGRLLWEASLPGVGKSFSNLAHQPGANATGTNYLSLPDGIFVAYNNVCLRLDPATGRKLFEYKIPLLTAKDPVEWSYINVQDQYLVGGCNILLPNPKPNQTGVSSSKHLFVLNRNTGKKIWQTTARNGFRHNAICLGGGRLFCIDRPSKDFLARLRTKDKGEGPARLAAHDLATGEEAWRSEEEVFGTWLSYSEKHDVLIESGRVARDTLSDEAKGMRAWRAADGTMMWHQKSYVGPAMIHGDTILKERGACDVLTGKVKTCLDPITGLAMEWTWGRGYGCNTPAASEHLLTFRSGAAGYYDLCNEGGTGNFGGFRSSCTNNLIVAGGLLTAPEYTRTCTCAYQNQTSLALAPMPEAEMWTSMGQRTLSGPVKRLGVNFGGPGDRKADDGTLWLEFPSVGGGSPLVPIVIAPQHPQWFRRHSSQVEADEDEYSWVACSGVKGIESIKLTLGKSSKERLFTVRLHFAEPDRLQAHERVFDVALQGETVLNEFDIAFEAGGFNKAIVKEFKEIKVRGDLQITFTPSPNAKIRTPLICGVEVVAEE